MENEEKIVENNETIENESTLEQTEQKTTEEVVTSNNSNDDFQIKKKGNKKPFIISGILVILLAVGLYFGYKMYFNPKNIFKKSIDNGYKEIENFIDELSSNAKLDNKNIKAINLKQDLSVNLKVNDMLSSDENVQSIISEINKMKLEMEVGYDLSNIKTAMTLGALYDNKSLINLGAYVNESSMYIELKDLFDKYIEIPMEDTYKEYLNNSNIKFDEDDLKYVLKASKDAFKDNLDSKTVKTSKKTIKINGKKLSTTKVSYGLSEKSANELAKNILEKLVKDDKFLKALASISDQDKNDLKDSFEEAIEEIKENLNNDLETKEEVFINFYVTGVTKKVVGYELMVKDQDTKEEVVISYYNKDDNGELNFSSGKEKLLNASFSNNNLKMTIYADEDEINLNVDKKVKDKTTTYDYKLKVEEISIEGSIIETIKKEDKNGNVEAEDEVSVKMITTGIELFNLTLKGNSEVEYKDKIELPDVSNSIKYTELTEADTNAIMVKLMENKTLVNLITKFSGVNGTN